MAALLRVVIVEAALLLTCRADPALAHALLLRSSPGEDAMLARAPTSVHLWFSEALNPVASTLVVWDQHRRNVVAGVVRVPASHTEQMQVQLAHLTPGSYLVLWTSISADDGHLLRGQYVFSVRRPGPVASLQGVYLGNSLDALPDPAQLAALLAHWCELLLLTFWAGIASLWAFVLTRAGFTIDCELARRQLARMRISVRLALVLLLLASLVALILQAFEIAGETWSGVLRPATVAGTLDDQYGQVWVGRQAVALIALVLTFTVRGKSVRETWREFAGVQTVVSWIYLFALAADGHAAGVNVGVLPGQHAHLFTLAIAIDWLHAVANALWLGGQMAIALVLLPSLHDRRVSALPTTLEALDRYSPLALASVAVLALTGAFNGAVHLSSVSALWTTVYGVTLVAKMTLIGAMVLVSSVTVLRVRPRVRAILSRGDPHAAALHFDSLQRWLRINPVLGAGVLLATAVLFYYPVPSAGYLL